MMTLREQVELAIKKVDALFYRGAKPPIPEGATVESLWDEILRLRGVMRPPKKIEAIQLLLEDPELSMIPIPLLADIMQRTFAVHGVECRTTDNSIRWYISQMTQTWNIQQRRKINHGDESGPVAGLERQSPRE